ncbi:hypothetical protein BGX33_002179 [Mortierella sp. NVP41]|nr:hypothetical protein BGX33_002179 [Mortierella sp. NVP41]
MTTEFTFKPKDLLPAIAVNRLFRAMLTPLHYTVYWEHNSNPDGFKDYNREDAFNKHHDYVSERRSSRKNISELQLNCTRLQELRLSPSVDSAWVGQLIQATPDLRVLDCERTIEHFPVRDPEELRLLFSLRQLRSLTLHDWRLNPVYLHHILDNHAQSFEEPNLGRDTYHLQIPSVNAEWDGLETETLFEMTDEQVAEANQWVQGRSLLLHKVKTLHLNVKWFPTSTSTSYLVRAFPAPEKPMIGQIYEQDAVPLGECLRQFCPNLRSIQNSDLGFDNCDLLLAGGDHIVHIIEACAPGNLVQIALNLY